LHPTCESWQNQEMRHPSLNKRTFLPRIALLVLLAVGCGGNAARPAVSDAHLSGERIIFMSDRDGDFEVFSMDPDGSRLQRHTSNSAYDGEATWSPDGSQIIFSSGYLEGEHQTIKEIIDGVDVFIDKEVVGDRELRVSNTDSMDSTAVTDNSAATDTGADWSPDGSLVAFHSDPDEGGVSEIYSMKPDGTEATKLTSLGGMNRDPSWSPDGENIVFAHFASDWMLYAITADGTESTMLDKAGSGWQPAWSTAGDQIAFASQRDGYWNIYVAQVDGKDPVRLTNNEGDNLEPEWSPAGDRITFGSNRNGVFEVFIMDSDGGNIFTTGQSGFPSDWVYVR
jgi:Tol biopolymer transport system component